MTVLSAGSAREKPMEKESEKVILYKWTGTCERCYQRGHKPVNCTASKRNKKFVELMAVKSE